MGAASGTRGRRDGWFVVVVVGAVLMVMAMWGTQRRESVLEAVRAVRAELDGRATEDEVLGQVRREARAVLVSEVERRAPKYGAQEVGLFVVGVGLFLGGLAGSMISARRRGMEEADQESEVGDG